MAKRVLILLFLFTAAQVYSQDGIFWGFSIRFGLSRSGSGAAAADSLSSLEFYVNEGAVAGANRCNRKLTYDTAAGKYAVVLGYEGIGGASQVAKIRCPDIYIKANFISSDTSRTRYAQFIPLYFEITKGNFQSCDLGVIDMDAIRGKAAVLVKPDGSVRIAYDYQPRKILLLIRLE